MADTGVTMIVFPCRCGHRNRVGSVRESYRKFILDQLGTCKRCKRELRKYQFSIKETETFRKVNAEIEAEMQE